MTPEEDLQEFVERGSEAAFGRVVRAYANLVYSTARYQVRDVHLAEDVTQAVFIILAKRARGLGRGGRNVVLAGWLVQTTYFAAANALKMEARRRRHERRAAAMKVQTAAAEDAVPFETIAPHLNGAMARLRAADRDALVLRYFQQKPYREIALAAGVTEAAARKRVERGLGYLRRTLGRHGVGVSEAGLEKTLAVPRLEEAPAAIMGGLASKALAGAKGAAAAGGGWSGGVSISKGAMAMMMWTKMKVAAVAAVGILLVSGGTVVVKEMARPKEVAVAAPAEGGVAGEAVRRSGPRGDGRTRAVAAAPASHLRVKVVDKRGRALEGALVEVFEDNGGEVMRDQLTRQRGTESDGITPPLPNIPWPRVVLYAKAAGYAPEVKRVAVGNEPVVVEMELEEAKVLSGKVVNKEGAPVAGATVIVDRWRQTRILNERLRTDEEGNFRWEGAPGDDMTVDVLIAAYADKRKVTVKAGAENKITLTEKTLVVGSVVDAATGKAVEKFKVSYGDINGTGAAASTFWLPDQENRGMKAEMTEGGFEVRLNDHDKMRVRVTAEGYAPADSPVYTLEGQTERYTFKLQKAAALVGTLVDEGGKAVVGAKVYIATGGKNPLRIENRQVEDSRGLGPEEVVSDEAGHFLIPPQGEPYVLAAMSEDGFKALDQATFEREQKVVVEKWGRIEGEVRDGTKAAPGEKVAISYIGDPTVPSRPAMSIETWTLADGEGKFVLEGVRPGRLRVGKRTVQGQKPVTLISGDERTETLTVKPGETVHVQVGGVGREVAGRVEVPAEWKGAVSLELSGNLKEIDERPFPLTPVEVMEMATEAYKNWRESDTGKALQVERSKVTSRPEVYIYVGKDGAFRVRGVRSGKYELSFYARRQIRGADNRPTTDGPLIFMRDLEVPEMAGGVSDEVLDVGAMALAEKWERVKVGESATGITFVTFEGKTMALGDFRGKYVLVNLWNNRGDQLPERGVLQGVWEMYGTSRRLAMVGIYGNARPEDGRAYVAARPMPWIQGLYEFGSAGWKSSTKLGSLTGKSSALLIDPEGKVVAMDLRGEAVRNAVEKVMGK